jgi:hypothetical protein
MAKEKKVKKPSVKGKTVVTMEEKSKLKAEIKASKAEKDAAVAEKDKKKLKQARFKLKKQRAKLKKVTAPPPAPKAKEEAKPETAA